LPAGKDNGCSLQTLAHSGRLQQLDDWLRHKYRFVLWDTPSLIRYAEGRFLLGHVDGVVVVVEADKTARDLLVQLRELLAGHSELFGVIMNRTGRYSLFGDDSLYDRSRRASTE
jgi:Mrp family chromosome partitioning ATPase